MPAIAESRTLDRIAALAFLAVLIWASGPQELLHESPAVAVPTLTMLGGVLLAFLGFWMVEDPDGDRFSRREGLVAGTVAAIMGVLGAVYYGLGWTAGISWGYPVTVVLLALIWLFSRMR